MSDCTHRHDHGHVHDHPHRDQKEVGCCGDGTTCSVPIASSSSTGAGRSFRVSGLDCAEEVAILNKAVGPEVGGTDHLAFDVLAEGGTFVSKVLAGGTEGELQKLLKQRFDKVANVKPPASRADSSEKFVVATGFRG